MQRQNANMVATDVSIVQRGPRALSSFLRASCRSVSASSQRPIFMLAAAKPACSCACTHASRHGPECFLSTALCVRSDSALGLDLKCDDTALTPECCKAESSTCLKLSCRALRLLADVHGLRMTLGHTKQQSAERLADSCHTWLKIAITWCRTGHSPSKCTN